jgi:hypothetical protein
MTPMAKRPPPRLIVEVSLPNPSSSFRRTEEEEDDDATNNGAFSEEGKATLDIMMSCGQASGAFCEDSIIIGRERNEAMMESWNKENNSFESLHNTRIHITHKYIHTTISSSSPSLSLSLNVYV